MTNYERFELDFFLGFGQGAYASQEQYHRPDDLASLRNCSLTAICSCTTGAPTHSDTHGKSAEALLFRWCRTGMRW
jgi:hypothetical protein